MAHYSNCDVEWMCLSVSKRENAFNIEAVDYKPAQTNCSFIAVQSFHSVRAKVKLVVHKILSCVTASDVLSRLAVNQINGFNYSTVMFFHSSYRPRAVSGSSDEQLTCLLICDVNEDFSLSKLHSLALHNISAYLSSKWK